MHKFYLLFILLCSLFTIKAETSDKASVKPKIAVSIAPQAFIIKELLGNLADVETLVPPGAAAETYAPKPSQLTALSSARAYFTIGFSFEDILLPKIKPTCPNLAIFDMRHNVKLIKMTNHMHNGKPCACGNSPYDPHIWVSPKRMITIAETAMLQLVSLFPEWEQTIRENHLSLNQKLVETHQYIEQLLKPYHGSSFYIYHPGFGYFAQDYGLQQVALELNGKAPSSKQMSYFIRRAREENIKIIFVQRQFAADSAEALARVIRAEIVRVENLSEDYIATAKETAEKIIHALELKKQ